ncbi:MAG: hypothetical protein WC919_04480 [Candidatus Paceibacterota bacterium]
MSTNSLETMMNGAINLVVVIPDVLKTPNIITRELQVLADGVSVAMLDASDKGQVEVNNLQVRDSTTITIEMRGIYDTGAMSAPLVHEFIILDGIPEPRSELFNTIVLKRP